MYLYTADNNRKAHTYTGMFIINYLLCICYACSTRKFREINLIYLLFIYMKNYWSIIHIHGYICLQLTRSALIYIQIHIYIRMCVHHISFIEMFQLLMVAYCCCLLPSRGVHDLLCFLVFNVY